MEIKINLRRLPDGRFRPAAPEPSNLEEAREYRALLPVADEVDAFFTTTQEEVTGLRALDNTDLDYNSSIGIVATGDRENLPDLFTVDNRYRALHFDPKTGNVASYEETFFDVRDNVVKTTKYSDSPLALSQEINDQDVVKNRWIHTTRTLTDVGNGLYEFCKTSSQREMED